MTIVRCAPDDPNRCQALISGRTQQCQNKAAHGRNYCEMHGGGQSSKEKQRNYNLLRWKEEIEAKADSPVIKQIHEEIGLLRFLLEKTINKCETESDLMINQGVITDLVCKIERLVVSCNVLDTRLGNSLDKSQLLKFAGVIIDIIATNCEDVEMCDLIANEIIQALGDPTTFEVE